MSQSGQFVFKLPDLGEGTVEAEIVRWYAKPGDVVAEDQAIVEVMTEKASVEVPAPVSGRVISVTGAPGDKVAVGSPLIVFDIDAGDKQAAPPIAPAPAVTAAAVRSSAAAPSSAAAAPEVVAATRVMASPANRRRAREAGLSLANLQGSGPRGRILQSDIAAASAQANKSAPTPLAPTTVTTASDTTTEIKVIGLRRVIAQRMAEAKRNIPHFAYVDEVDVTELEALRQHLNDTRHSEQPTLTYLPLVILALTRTLALHPQCNVRYDEARGVLVRHSAVHVGVATQTPDGLKVPVVRHAESLSLWELATAIRG
jgi:2-oxoisovalerate dehydrogenase E2 component (dihydrolipoyl transacylase)